MSGIVNKVGSNSGKIWDGLSRAEIPILPTPGADGTLLTSDGTNWAVEAPDPAFTAPAGSTWDAVAEGALSNGDRVLIRSDGKIEVANDAGTASDNVTPGNQNQTLVSGAVKKRKLRARPHQLTNRIPHRINRGFLGIQTTKINL